MNINYTWKTTQIIKEKIRREQIEFIRTQEGSQCALQKYFISHFDQRLFFSFLHYNWMNTVSNEWERTWKEVVMTTVKFLVHHSRTWNVKITKNLPAET